MISAIGIALATLVADAEDGKYAYQDELVASLLLGGFFSLLGSVIAMTALWDEAGLRPLDVLRLGWGRPLGTKDLSLVANSWGMLVLGAAYLVLSVSVAR